MYLLLPQHHPSLSNARHQQAPLLADYKVQESISRVPVQPINQLLVLVSYQDRPLEPTKLSTFGNKVIKQVTP